MRTVKTTFGTVVLLSLGLTSYALGGSSENWDVRGADWDASRAITQNLPVADSHSILQSPYGNSIDLNDYLTDDAYPPYLRKRYREQSEPDVFSEKDSVYYKKDLGLFPGGRSGTSLKMFPKDQHAERNEPAVFSEDDTFYYDHQAFAHDRYGYAKQRFKKAAQRYKQAKRNFSREQLRFFSELDRFREEKEQFASASAGFAKAMLGNLQKRDGNIYVLENSKGQTHSIHIGQDTLIDQSIEKGDDVIAKVLPNGHAIALVKDRGEKGISAQSRSGMK